MLSSKQIVFRTLKSPHPLQIGLWWCHDIRNGAVQVLPVSQHLRHGACRWRECDGKVATTAVSDGYADDDVLYINNAPRGLTGAAGGLVHRRQHWARTNNSVWDRQVENKKKKTWRDTVSTRDERGGRKQEAPERVRRAQHQRKWSLLKCVRISMWTETEIDEV